MLWLILRYFTLRLYFTLVLQSAHYQVLLEPPPPPLRPPNPCDKLGIQAWRNNAWNINDRDEDEKGIHSQIMWRGNPSSGEQTLHYDSILVGLSSAGFTAIIPRFYRSAARVSMKPSRFLAAMLAPPLCGSIAAFSWHYLLSNPIREQKLKCSACACIRGGLIAVLNGCLLPSFVVALLHFKRKSSLRQPVIATFLDFCYSPYYGRSKSYMIGLGVFQAVLGYGLAGWVYTEELIKTRNT